MDKMDKKETMRIKSIERKAYEVYKEVDALIDHLQRENVDWEIIDELKVLVMPRVMWLTRCSM